MCFSWWRVCNLCDHMRKKTPLGSFCSLIAMCCVSTVSGTTATSKFSDLFNCQILSYSSVKLAGFHNQLPLFKLWFCVITLVYKNACCIYFSLLNVFSLFCSMFGDAREMELHYFLADDTVEICERIPNNSGRDAVPMFLRRQRLPKVKF